MKCFSFAAPETGKMSSREKRLKVAKTFQAFSRTCKKIEMSDGPQLSVLPAIASPMFGVLSLSCVAMKELASASPEAAATQLENSTFMATAFQSPTTFTITNEDSLAVSASAPSDILPSQAKKFAHLTRTLTNVLKKVFHFAFDTHSSLQRPSLSSSTSATSSPRIP